MILQKVVGRQVLVSYTYMLCTKYDNNTLARIVTTFNKLYVRKALVRLFFAETELQENVSEK